MARDIIDDRLIGALHVRALTRGGFAHDPAAERVAFQVGTLDALIDGRFDGDATIAELLDHGDLGLGTVQHLGGELVILDGHAFVIDADGCVHEVHPSTRTPFAVVCRFAAREHRGLVGPMPLADVQRELDGLASHTAVIAVRVDGTFTHLRLRSVREQVRPYPPLAEVTAHQTEWDLARADGTLLGFRFPDDVAGLEAPDTTSTSCRATASTVVTCSTGRSSRAQRQSTVTTSSTSSCRPAWTSVRPASPIAPGSASWKADPGAMRMSEEDAVGE
jgi:acetolactate decarboxylase